MNIPNQLDVIIFCADKLQGELEAAYLNLEGAVEEGDSCMNTRIRLSRAAERLEIFSAINRALAQFQEDIVETHEGS
jgi:hypothetical protein